MGDVTIAELQAAVPVAKEHLLAIYQQSARNASGFSGDTRKLTVEQLMREAVHEAIREKTFPVGSTYVQYPVIAGGTLPGIFPDAESPKALYGGEWASEIVPVGLLPPCYADYDPKNKIVANNTSWTADKKGYVRCNISGAAVGNTCVIKKNDVTVQVGIVAVAAGWTYEALLPVLPGDVITLSTNGTPAAGDWARDPFKVAANAANLKWSGCYFVPERSNPLLFPQGFVRKWKKTEM